MSEQKGLMTKMMPSTPWQPVNTSIEMWLTAPKIAPVAQKVGRELADICASTYTGLGAVSFGFVPIDTRIIAAGKTDWHVMRLCDLLSYQLFGKIEMPRDPYDRIHTMSIRDVRFDELYIAVETEAKAPLSLAHTTAPAGRGHGAYSVSVLNGYNFVRAEDEETTRRMQLDPILFGVKFIGRVTRGDARLVGMMELARWNW